MQADNKKTISPKIKIKNLCYDSIYGRASSAAIETVAKDYRAFDDFIYNAKEASKIKENLSAKYFRVDGRKELFLSSWYKLEVYSKIIKEKIVSNFSEIETLRKYGVEILDIPIRKITVNGLEMHFYNYQNEIYIQTEETKNIIINDNQDIAYDLKQHFPELVIYRGQKIAVKNNRLFLDDFNEDICDDYQIDFIKYKLTSKTNTGLRKSVLIEIEDDETLEDSVYETFFSEEVTEVYFNDNKNHSYKIARKLKESGQLEIEVSNKSEIEREGQISIRANTYQLSCQSRAIQTLISFPSVHHKPLLTLSDDKTMAKLDPFYPVLNSGIDFKILTNNNYKGNENQRIFVEKALQTSDFMILEGPPGSGKTTAILEFIYQATKRGEKVILAASTHVAIDNVLEKILDHKNSREMMQFINPVRIGVEESIYVDSVKRFLYDNIMSCISPNYKEMVEESFNLVCGTTIGILQYPIFKKALTDNRNLFSSIEPMFDYLIIDEASKTTFNEFLVPAIFAKKWIIVGDVKQLAPYVEKNNSIPTILNSQSLKNKALRDAIYFKMMIKKTDYNELKNKAFIMDGSTIQKLDKFLDKDKFVAITSLKTENLVTISNQDIKTNSYKLCILDSESLTYIVDDQLIKKVLPYFNPKVLCIAKKINIARDTYFNDYAIIHHRTEDFYKKTRNLDDAYSKKLEDELMWRLSRMYELENSKTNSVKSYEEYINEVQNYLDDNMKKDYDKTISMISEIALPSIITLLQQGIKKRTVHKKTTILNSGFSDEDKANRFLTLEYQYRMHPEISCIPRRHVYNDSALKDDIRSFPDFKYYLPNERRLVVTDVNGAIISRNQNEKEALKVIEYIKKISDYASKENIEYKIAVLAFYNGQVILLRRFLQDLFKTKNIYNFNDGNVKVSLNTVDKFQGQEADIVVLTMVRNDSLGFMDSINRVNVAITRAKEKLIVIGDKKFFGSMQKGSTLLKSIFNGDDN